MSNLNLCAVQTSIDWLEVEKNFSHLEHLLAPVNSVDLIILPETFATGFAVKDRRAFETEKESAILAWMKNLAKSKKAYVCGSALIEANIGKVNRLYWVSPQGQFDFYDKKHLFSLAGESETMKPGLNKVIVELNDFRINLNVCYDLRFPEWSRSLDDYDLMINVANWPSMRRHAWDILLQARAIENQSYVVGVNRVGNDGNDVPHSGGTAVIDYLGQVISAADDHQTELIYASLSLSELNQFKQRYPFYQDAEQGDC